MPEIVTLTFNPCIDKSTTVDALIPEKSLGVPLQGLNRVVVVLMSQRL